MSAGQGAGTGSGQDSLEVLAQELRVRFDAAFAVARPEPRPRGVRLLVLATGAGSLAVRLDQVAALAPAPRLLPFPGASRAQLGLGSHQGRLVAVYSLPVLAGGPPGPARLVLIPVADPQLALAFDRFEGMREVPPGGLIRDERVGDGPLGELASIGDVTLRVLDPWRLVARMRAG